MIRNRKKTVFVFMLFCFYSFISPAQKMKNIFEKELMAKVGSICEETPDDNPCAGSQIYLALIFDKEQVSISEKYISSCDKESVSVIGTYNWKLLSNKKIAIDFIPDQTIGTYAQQLVLELRDKQIIGNITHLNGQVIEYTFDDKKH